MLSTDILAINKAQDYLCTVTSAQRIKSSISQEWKAGKNPYLSKKNLQVGNNFPASNNPSVLILRVICSRIQISVFRSLCLSILQKI